ncbi:MAG: ribonuclease E/G [Peptostreptococcus sp.]|uniref:ribonuclease E/G n=1 Tax=Peptostreptococcus sp. TaxID=1262 RepID=UPI002FCA2A23
MKEYFIEDFVSSSKLAVLKDKKIEKLLIEEKNNSQKLKNVYRGKIEKIMPAMKACFVDIGENNPGYLKLEEAEANLIEGDNILVQVIKEEKGDKRVKLSTEISISGRILVYIPSNKKLVFSNQIKSNDEKKRLKKILLNASDGEKGFILRTEAQGCMEDEIRQEVEDLRKKYQEIVQEYQVSFYPKKLYSKEKTILAYIREHLSDEIKNIVYLEGEMDSEIRSTVKSINPLYLEKLDRKNNMDIFEGYGINNELKKYLSRVVRLKSGAYIVLDKTEAMTVIDVNTGSFKGDKSYEDTVFQANMQACDEISRQIITRDISGIIIVDFIDMKTNKNKKRVLQRMSENLSVEGNRSNVHGFTQLGLMEISRMRKENTIDDFYSSYLYEIDKIERKVINSKYHKNLDQVEIEIGESYYNILDKEKSKIKEIEAKYKVKICLIKK